MGIKNMSQFLKKHEVYETLNISSLRYVKIGVDTPMFMYKFKSMYPESKEWLGCFITFITFLRKWDIHPIFVFEGKAPPEKAPTQILRREQKQKIVDKTNLLQESLDAFVQKGETNPILFETMTKLKEKKQKSLLSSKATIIKNFINVEEIQDEINRRRKYEFSITEEDTNLVKELLELLKINFIQSKGEAETECVHLFYNGYIDYILSEDTDVLAYHHPTTLNLKVITTFNTNDLTFVQVSKERLLDTLNLTSKSFRDFCIMCGTDYNKNIFRIGIEKSYKFILEHYTIDNVPLDTSVLNHIRVRSLFEVTPGYTTSIKNVWCDVPNETLIDKLAMFIFTNSIKSVDVNNTFKALTEPNFTLEIE